MKLSVCNGYILGTLLYPRGPGWIHANVHVQSQSQVADINIQGEIHSGNKLHVVCFLI